MSGVLDEIPAPARSRTSLLKKLAWDAKKALYAQWHHAGVLSRNGVYHLLRFQVSKWNCICVALCHEKIWYCCHKLAGSITLPFQMIFDECATHAIKSLHVAPHSRRIVTQFQNICRRTLFRTSSDGNCFEEDYRNISSAFGSGQGRGCEL